jgi:broad specificity phosphatase PhoE
VNATEAPRRRIVLVRHARSKVDPARPPREWGLTADGEQAAARLAALAPLAACGAFYAGPEPKLVQTLLPAAGRRRQAVVEDGAFAETASEGWLDEAGFRETVRRFFARRDAAPAAGWEPAAAAADRFRGAVERRLADAASAPGEAGAPDFAVASGGRALMAYLSGALGLDAGAAFARWQALRLPDVAVLEVASGAATRVVVPFGTLTL